LSEVVWSGKPYMRKTVIKFTLTFIILSFLLTLLLLPEYFALLVVWYIFASLYFVYYYFNKKAFTYVVTERSVRVEKSWIFGTHQREITMDQIRDVYIKQGTLARRYNCGSLVFVTTTGLEVGYAHTGAGAGTATKVGVLVGGGAGASVPVLVEGGGNTFWDVLDPTAVRGMLLDRLTEWREAFQQQRMAVSLEKIAEQTKQPSASLVTELEKLTALRERGAITEEEYEKAKKKILE